MRPQGYSIIFIYRTRYSCTVLNVLRPRFKPCRLEIKRKWCWLCCKLCVRNLVSTPRVARNPREQLECQLPSQRKSVELTLNCRPSLLPGRVYLSLDRSTHNCLCLDPRRTPARQGRESWILGTNLSMNTQQLLVGITESAMWVILPTEAFNRLARLHGEKSSMQYSSLIIHRLCLLTEVYTAISVFFVEAHCLLKGFEWSADPVMFSSKRLSF